MRKCIEEKRQKAGLNGNGDRKVAREAAKANRKANMTACRDELKGQSLGKDERRTAMQGCMAKKDPQMGKQMACRQEATAKNLQQKTREFREFMRECRQRA